jgi:hypothetical protein
MQAICTCLSVVAVQVGPSPIRFSVASNTRARRGHAPPRGGFSPADGQSQPSEGGIVRGILANKEPKGKLLNYDSPQSYADFSRRILGFTTRTRQPPSAFGLFTTFSDDTLDVERFAQEFLPQCSHWRATAYIGGPNLLTSEDIYQLIKKRYQSSSKMVSIGCADTRWELKRSG